jgi:cellulase
MATWYRLVLLLPLTASLVAAQGVGIADVHPKITTQVCTKSGGCVDQQTSLVLDAGFHNLHAKNSTTNCGGYSGPLNPALCPDATTCANNCVFDAADYANSGVSTNGSSMLLNMYKQSDGTASPASPRVYLLDDAGKAYEMLRLLNQELTFDVDLSKLVCGMNGALYFSEMDATGGQSALNPAGAAYGTGYCDAQCPVQGFINGVVSQAFPRSFSRSRTNPLPKANLDSKGACCNEMDIWEANAISNAFTPHTCNQTGVYECTGDLCGSQGVCDKSGCGYNTYALGNKQYYGRNGTVDTNKVFTVVTQFLTDTGDASGKLKEIRRLYVQGGKVIQNAAVATTGIPAGDSITEAHCNVTAKAFERLGGLTEMGQSLQRGMVLIFSIWNDGGQFMNWLDSGSAGPCNATEGDPKLIQASHPDTSVTFSNIKWGDLNSTFKGTT